MQKTMRRTVCGVLALMMLLLIVTECQNLNESESTYLKSVQQWGTTCETKCGKRPGVTCSEPDDKGNIECICEDDAKIYVSKSQECKTCEQKPCKNSLDCKMDPNGKAKCFCKNGYYGATCEEPCSCINGQCVKDDEGKFTLCTCPSGFYKTSKTAKSCKDCDCGQGENCTYEDYKKTCLCNKGYYISDKNKKCKDCECGTGSVSCTFDDKGQKTCICEDGYRHINEQCVVEKCKDKCGTESGVTCTTYDGEGNIECLCADPTYKFISKEAGCEVDKCKDKCGTESGVTCTTYDGEGNIECICTDPTYNFISKEAGCEVGKCKDKCGIESGVTCTTDDGEGNFECICTDPTYNFISKEDGCEEACTKDEDCNTPRKFCAFDNTCMCKYGLEGEGCRIVTSCKNGLDKFCESAGAVCRFDENNKMRGACKCLDDRFIYNEDVRKCVDLCEPNPCFNGGECRTIGSRGFTCKCKEDYMGAFCNMTSRITDKRSLQDHTNDVILGAIVGLLVILLFITGIIRWKRR